MPEYASMIPEHAEICVNVPNLPEWLLFCFPILIPRLLERMVTYFSVYTKLEGYIVKGYEAVFLKRQNLIFLVVAGSIWFVFCFGPNIFTRFQIAIFNELGTKLSAKSSLN